METFKSPRKSLSFAESEKLREVEAYGKRNDYIIYTTSPVSDVISIRRGSKDMSKDAIRNISEKYDTLSTVKSTSSEQQQQQPYRKNYSRSTATLPVKGTSKDTRYNSVNNIRTEMGTRSEEQLSQLHISEAGHQIDSSPAKVEMKLTESDISQVESLLKSYKTEVYVSTGLANLYFASVPAKSCTDQSVAPAKGRKAQQPRVPTTSTKSSIQLLETEPLDWQLSYTGVPVLMLDTAVHGSKRTIRRLQLLLSERGSGFVLWKDRIDNLSNYKSSQHETFHTMFLSSDHRRLAGLSFDDEAAAREFLNRYKRLTSDPNDPALRTGMKKKKNKEKPKKIKPPKKADISGPCCFQHITKLGDNDRDHLYTMAHLLPKALGSTASPANSSVSDHQDLDSLSTT